MKFIHVFLPILFCLVGCKMPFDDNYFVNIPHEENANIQIALNLQSDGERLFINQPTTLCYYISASKKEIAKVRFQLGDKVWISEQKSGIISLPENIFPTGNYQLSCEFYLRSKTGSIANQLDTEYYGGRASWPVVIDYNLQLPALVRHSCTNERFLKLEWDEPDFSPLQIKRYDVIYQKDLSSRHMNVDRLQTSLVDSLYVGEGAEYTVIAVLEAPDDDKQIYWTVGRSTIPQEIQTKSVTLPDGTVRFSWVTPYQSNITLADLSTQMQYFPQEGATFFDFRFEPIHTKNWTDALSINFRVYPYNNKMNYIYNQTEQLLRYAVRIGDYWSHYAYSEKGDYICQFNHQKLQSYKLPDFTLVAETKLENNSVGGLTESPSGALISVHLSSSIINNNSYIYLYKDISLNNRVRITANNMAYNGLSNQQLIYLTTDEKLVYITSSSGPVNGVVCNTVNGYREKTFSIANESHFSYPLLSPDARRMCITTSMNSVILIELDNYVEKQRKILYDDYFRYTYLFHPHRHHELICVNSRKADVWDLRALKIVRTFELPLYTNLTGIDRCTGNLLCTSPNRLYILSSENGRILMETGNKESNLKLTNNYLMSGSGYVMNIEKQIVQ
ncbi:MAG: hypothetical protein RR346_08640 [Bacteroidales bacterium]